MLLTRLLLTGILVGTATLAARPAAACSPPPCWPATPIPGPGATVPANVPALGFTVTQTSGTFVGDPTGFQLIDPDGKAVGLSFEQTAPQAGSYFARPREPLQPNRTYRIRYPQTCPNFQPRAVPDTVEQLLMTGPATPVPASIGTARVTGHRVAMADVGYGLGLCGLTPLRAGLAHVEIQPSDEFRAYLALGSVSAMINGHSAPVVNYQQPGPGAAIEMDIYAHCAGDAGTSTGLEPGKYEVQFIAQLFGVIPLPPPISTTVEVYCDERASADASTDGAADARTSVDSGVASDGAAPADAGDPAADAGITLAGSHGCGCAVGSAQRAGVGPAAMLVLAALLLRRRRS